ncbi:MAG TPA: CocE/NonD family hydrolase, partial [Terriglobales bacterium]|nr:CocE/NonD family hydrolase [Terriglobales bacterium]
MGCLLGAPAGPAGAQRVRLPAGLADSAALAGAMPELAKAVLDEYRQHSRPDPARALDDRFRLEIVAGRYPEAARTLSALRALRVRAAPGRPEARAADLQYEIWANAMAASAATGRPFEASFASAFRDAFARLDERAAVLVMRAMAVAPRGLRAAARQELERHRPGGEVSIPEAVGIVRTYQRALTHESFQPLVGRLFDEDDARRYVTERDVRVRTPDGATVCALVMRPRAGPPRLPTLLTFTIYVDSAGTTAEARRAAANGYAGAVGYTRGKACSPDTPVPYRYDGRDAAALIDWIAARPWSDGRVGMYGGSYNGFAAWAAAKHAPRALRAIMVGAPAAPGIDVPMEGNIVSNFFYPWPFYTTNNRTLDDATYFDNARWWRMNREWYVSGRAYRDLPEIDGTPNPIFLEWLAHPAVDAYWRSTMPDGAEFSRITIPVLQTAGYYYGGPGAAMRYFAQHHAHNPRARHYLLIGPYDHVQAQRGVVSALGDTTRVLAGYEIDPVARLDIVADLRYRWFDWVLRGGPRPALLQDRVNYQVMDLNVWKHAPSVAAMSNGTLRLYLSGERSGGRHRLTRSPGGAASAVPLRVDLAYRADIDSTFPGGGVRDTAINTYEALTFVSDPLDGVEVSGLFSGHLEFVTNKRDFDLSVALFELTPAGEYVQLPPFQVRASYARDPAVRRLLAPGEPQTLDFTSIRLVSRRLARGSRIVAVIGPIKWPGQQINYG